MKVFLSALVSMSLIGGTLGVAAKLPPAASLDPAKAEEKKAKDAATAAVGAMQQAKAEDRVAAYYISQQKAKGKAVTPQMPSNWGEMEAKAKDAASKVPGVESSAMQPVAAAKLMAAKK